MFKISKFLVSLFGLGFFPKAPGTIGSIFAIIFFYLTIEYFSFLNLIIFFLILFFLSKKLIDIYSINKNNHDSSEIIIDEFIGIFFIIIFYDYIKFTNHLTMFIIIFLLFRFFDILKIYPANWIDKNLKSSFGVLLDDLVAAVYSIFVLLLINAFI
tara:strand:+ start:311 stop:778 length:468 start_codon:yes stop_codon:yes gene_type:complete